MADDSWKTTFTPRPIDIIMSSSLQTWCQQGRVGEGAVFGKGSGVVGELRQRSHVWVLRRKDEKMVSDEISSWAHIRVLDQIVLELERKPRAPPPPDLPLAANRQNLDKSELGSGYGFSLYDARTLLGFNVRASRPDRRRWVASPAESIGVEVGARPSGFVTNGLTRLRRVGERTEGREESHLRMIDIDWSCCKRRLRRGESRTFSRDTDAIRGIGRVDDIGGRDFVVDTAQNRARHLHQRMSGVALIKRRYEDLVFATLTFERGRLQPRCALSVKWLPSSTAP